MTHTDMHSSASSAGLTLENVRKVYRGLGDDLVILDDVNLSVAPGNAAVIMGPSGSGKSTLLHIIGALDRPTGGTVRLGNESPFSLSDRALAHFRNRAIGFVFQDHYLLPQCTVLENVLIPALANRGVGDAEEARARSLLERVGLSARLDHRPGELSGGERQRAAIARALINQPAMLLADEPTGNLDRKSAETIAQLLLEMPAQHQVVVVLVTHSLELADPFPIRYELRDGRLEPRSSVGSS